MLNFQDLYDDYVIDVYRFANWLSGDRFEAEDITSETFIRAWMRINTIRTETLKAYLFAIARNVYLEMLRKRKNQVALSDAYPDSAPELDELVASQLELRRARRVLMTLSEIDRAAFLLRVQHELPYAEIARILELSLTATKVKVHRVRKKLIAAGDEKEIC